MFAIVDVETTGGRSDKDKIIEISVILHDGLTQVDRFDSLINPGRPIPAMITRLTGITNAMVADAPQFYEVARELVEITSNAVFVAHNVNFDYGFIKAEFKSLGYDFKRDLLCTVRMSRKLIPGRKSYSLGRLCESLGILHESAHRASGDTEATTRLFELLLQVKSQHPQFRSMSMDAIMATRTEKIKSYVLDKLPKSCGVYFLKGKNGEILYIGRSKDMNKRVNEHFRNPETHYRKLRSSVLNVDFVETGSELLSILMEAAEIRKHLPSFNRLLKQEAFSHGIYYSRSEDGDHLAIRKTDEESTDMELILPCPGYAHAREKLEQWIFEYRLCNRFCNLSDGRGPCFEYQLKRCEGICAGVEDPAEYNIRVRRLVDEMRFPEGRFLVKDKGRSKQESCFLEVDNGQVKGYCFVRSDEDIQSAYSILDRMEAYAFSPDSGYWLNQQLKRSSLRLIPLAEE